MYHQDLGLPASFPRYRNKRIIIKVTPTGYVKQGKLRGKNAGRQNFHRQRKITNLKTDVAAEPTMSLPGIEKLFGSSNCCTKLIWICAVIAFYGLCIYQLMDRVNLYLSLPIEVDVHVEKKKLIDFPSVTICPAYEKKMLEFKQCELKKRLKNLQKSNGGKKLKILNTTITVDDIWKEFSIEQDKIKISGSCGSQDDKTDQDEEGTGDEEDKDRCSRKFAVTNTSIPTLYGNCVQITPATSLMYRGAWTYILLKLRYRDREIKGDPKCIKLLKDSQNETVFIPVAQPTKPTHEAAKLFYTVTRGSAVSVTFSEKQFVYLNTKKHPCVDRETLQDCKAKCLERLVNKKVNCSLPFMGNTTHRPCNTLDDAIEAFQTVLRIYRQFDDCNCTRPCQERFLSFTADYHATTSTKNAIFTISFPDNTVEVITERISYNINSLVSDIGGNLGSCVGLCLFSFIEIGFNVLHLAINILKRKSKAANGKSNVNGKMKRPQF